VELGTGHGKIERLGICEVHAVKIGGSGFQIGEFERELISNNVIITGLKDTKDETPAQLFGAVEALLMQMNLQDVDYSYARRLGPPKDKKTRAVQLKLVRQKDKCRIFNSKKELLKHEETKKIFI